MSTWIETSVRSRLVLERRVKDIRGVHPDDMGWQEVVEYSPSMSIEKAREAVEQSDSLSPDHDHRLVYERIETRREDVTQ